MDKKISQFTSAQNLKGGFLLPMAFNGENYKCSLDQLKTFLGVESSDSSAINNIKTRLTTAESAITNILSAVENIRTIKVSDRVDFESKERDYFVYGGLSQVIYQDTGETEYWICANGEIETLDALIYGEGSFKVPFLHVRIKSTGIYYRVGTYAYHSAPGTMNPQYIYDPSIWGHLAEIFDHTK